MAVFLFFLSRRYERVPVILVGNKVDLDNEREVSSSEGQALAEEWGCPFMETSAKSKTMVDELFAEIVRQMDYASLPDKEERWATVYTAPVPKGFCTTWNTAGF
ncbi:hypothetical protein ACEWY4_016838 [Coilia grayii]|uniref:Small monomeric GTPase n=1 Tax=Coilia grayii TaxID=363190 RepID=A0ABD1JLI7_9TELE